MDGWNAFSLWRICWISESVPVQVHSTSSTYLGHKATRWPSRDDLGMMLSEWSRYTSASSEKRRPAIGRPSEILWIRPLNMQILDSTQAVSRALKSFIISWLMFLFWKRSVINLIVSITGTFWWKGFSRQTQSNARLREIFGTSRCWPVRWSS